METLVHICNVPIYIYILLYPSHNLWLRAKWPWCHSSPATWFFLLFLHMKLKLTGRRFIDALETQQSFRVVPNDIKK